MTIPARRKIYPGSRIRVLIVDDSVVIRRLVAHAVEEDDSLEVAGSASNGLLALQRIPQVNPDVVTLDIEMPEMNGLDTLREIRKLYPNLYVIMFSTLTARGGEATIEALSLGASDYVAKCPVTAPLEESIAILRSDLIPKIKQFFNLGLPVRAVPQAWKPESRSTSRPCTTKKVVVIGVSTGGPTALAVIIPMFPKDFPLPILLVQHMPPLFTRLLAERLDTQSKLHVEEAHQGSVVEAGKILIAAGDYHLKLRREGNKMVAQLDQSAPENSCRPAADVTLRSVADLYGGSCIVAVLTGMGQDGLRGVQALQALGAYIIAQDEQSSVVWGMPGAIVKAGLADSVVDLHAIVPEILKQI